MGYIKRIIMVVAAILSLGNIMKATTYQDVKAEMDHAKNKLDAINAHSKPTIDVGFDVWGQWRGYKELNNDFVNMYEDTHNAIANAANKINQFNSETTSNSNVSQLTTQATNRLTTGQGPNKQNIENYGRKKLNDAYSYIKQAFDMLEEEEEASTVISINDGSFVYIKCDGKYLDADKSSGSAELKFKDVLNSINQIFKIKIDGPNVGFAPMNDYTSVGNYIEAPSEKAVLLNNAWDAGKYFKIVKVDGASDTYNLKFKRTGKWLKRDGSELKASDINIGSGSEFKFEIKEFTLDNPVARTILNQSESFGRNDLVTIRSVTNGKYISSSTSPNDVDPKGDSAKKLVFSDQITTLSVFRVLSNSSETDFGSDASIQDFLERDEWKRIRSTYTLGFLSGDRSTLDSGYGTCYFVKSTGGNLHSGMKFYKVLNPNYYIIKNAKYDKYLKIDGNRIKAEADEGSAKKDRNSWFEITKFNVTEELPEEVSFNSGDIVTIKIGGQYLTMPSQADNDGKHRAHFQNQSNQANQKFKVLKVGNNYAFIGTKTGEYTGNNAGMLNTNTSWNYAAYFDMGKISNPSNRNLFRMRRKRNGKISLQTLYNNQYEVKRGVSMGNFVEDIYSNFEIQKIELPTAPNGETLVNLQEGRYRIKNIETNKYMTILSSNIEPNNIYHSNGQPWNMFSLRFKDQTNDNNQIFKVTKENDGWYKILGSLNGTFTGENAGIFDVGTGRAYFNKNTTATNNYRRVNLTRLTTGNVNEIFISAKIHGNSKYGVDDSDNSGQYPMIKDNAKNKFVFERVEESSSNTPPQGQTPGQGESFVDVEPGIYKIKNVETDKYMTILSSNIEPNNIYHSNGQPWNMFSLRFKDQTNDNNQIFKVTKENDGWYKILGSLNGTFTGENAGIFDVGTGRAYFNKNTTATNNYRRVKMVQHAGVQGYYLTSQQTNQSKYGVDEENDFALIKDINKNNRFVFEKTEAPSTEKEESHKELKVTGINMKFKEVPGGLTKVSVGGTLICGINSSNQLYKWDNIKNTWAIFSDAKYKDVSVGQDNTILAIGTDNRIYTHYNNEWKLFGRGIFPDVEIKFGSAASQKSTALPAPESTTLPAPGSTGLPAPGSATSLPAPTSNSATNVDTTSAQSIPMKQISVGARDKVWALGNDNKAYFWNGSSWEDKSQMMSFSQISVGMDGSVKALGSDKKLISWNGANWQISPFKLHQVCVINKDKHWAITKEDDGSFNLYKFSNNAYVLRAKNLQQFSVNQEGTIFGISTLKTSGGFKIYARIIKLFGKILDKINSVTTKTTVKEKIITLNQAINLADPTRISSELKPDEHGALKNQMYTVIYGLLTNELTKAKEEKESSNLKKLVYKAIESPLIEENIKPLLKNFADTNIKIEEAKKEEGKKTDTKTSSRRVSRRISRRVSTPKARTNYRRPGSRGGRFVR